MAIDPDEIIRADDFINESERDATPANDAGKVAKLNEEGRIQTSFIQHYELVINRTIGADSSEEIFTGLADYTELYVIARPNVLRDSSVGSNILFQASIDDGATWLGSTAYQLMGDGTSTSSSIRITTVFSGMTIISISLPFFNSSHAFKEAIYFKQSGSGDNRCAILNASPLNAFRLFFSGGDNHRFGSGAVFQVYGKK